MVAQQHLDLFRRLNEESVTNSPTNKSNAIIPMVRYKKYILVFLSLFLLTIIAGCDFSKDESNSNTKYLNARERIIKSETISVGLHLDNSFEMFMYMQIDGPKGFDVDLTKIIVDGLKKQYSLPNLTWKPKYLDWPEIVHKIMEPEQQEIDFAISSISITEKRKKDGIIFSSPYYETDLSVIYKEEDGDDLGRDSDIPFPLEKLCDLKIGVHLGTTAVSFVEEHACKNHEVLIHKYDTNDKLFAALPSGGEVDIIIYDYVRALAELRTSFSQKEERAEWILRRIDSSSINYPKETYGVAFGRKNIALAKDVSEIINANYDLIQNKINKRISAITN